VVRTGTQSSTSTVRQPPARYSRRAYTPLASWWGDHGIDHHENWLRFTYVFISARSRDLPPYP
jgi:hypothetical protein